MAKQTWDANRTGGGTYEFTKDAQGKYVLSSVGFQKLNKLNLPDLGVSDTKTTKKDTTTDTAKLSKQTSEAFGDVKPFYYDNKGGGADQQYTQQYEMTKDKSLSTKPSDRQPGFAISNEMGMTKKFSDRQPGFEVANKGITKQDTTPAWAQDTDKRGYENINKDISVKATDQIGRQNVDEVLDARAQTDRFGTGQWGPKPSKGMPVDKTYRSETQKFKERFDPTKIKAAPQKATLTQTALKTVSTGLKPLAKAVGFVVNPVGSVLGMVAGSFKETPTNKHDKSYFNVNENGRIAGNPSTDLFAGMNRVSMGGNLSQSGLSRISKRNSAKTQANLDLLSPERKAAFNAKTKEMEKQLDGYNRSKNDSNIDHAKSKGVNVSQLNPHEMKNVAETGNADGSGGGRVICTELHSTGEMSTRDWLRDIKFTYKDLSKEHIKGYLLWAVPTVEHIKKYPTYRKFWKHLAQHRANDIAWRLNQGKFDLLGRIYAGIGEPLCWLIGKCISDKQIKELELSNWRKA